MIALVAFLTLLGSARALHNTPAPTPAPSSTDHHHDDDHHVEIAPDDVYPARTRYRHGAPTAEWIPASYQMGEEDFDLAFQASANGIVRVDVWGYLRVYYRRVVDKETFTPYYYLFNNWNPHRNEYGVDYELYRTYTAALNRDDSDDSTPTCNDVKEAFANEPGSFPGKGFPYGCEFMEGDFGYMYKSTGSQVGFDGARALERDPESCSRVMNGTFACDTASAAKHDFLFPHGWRVYLESPQPLSERWHPPPDVQFVTLAPNAGVEGEGDLDVAGEVDQFTIRTRARVVEAGKVFALYRTAGTSGTPDPSDPFLVLKARTVDAKMVFELFVDTGVDGCEVTLVTNASWTEPESVDLAVTYDDGAAAVYVDGSLDAMGSMPAECVSPTTKPTQWRLGDAGSGMAGDVNFLTVWSRTALAPWRVRRAALADYSHVPPPDHHFNFDEPPGTTEVTNSIDNGRRSSASLDPGCEIVGVHDGSLAQLDTSLAVLDADVHVHVPWTSKLAKVFQGSFSMQMWVKPGGDVEEDVELNIFGNYDVSDPEFGDCSCACDGKPVANGTINVTDDQGAMGVTSRQCAAAGPQECGDMVTDGVIDACPGGVDFTAVWSYNQSYTGANFDDGDGDSTSTYHGDCECLCETAVGDGGCSGEVGVPKWCHINVTGDISGKGIPEDACSVHGPGVCDTYANYFLAANISHLFPQCNGTNFTTKWSYNSTYTGAVWSDDEDSTDSGSGGGAECRCYCGSEKTQAQYAGYVNGITSEQCIQDGPTSTTFGCPGSETHFSQTCDTYYVEYVANPGGTTGRKLMQDSGPDGESYQGYSGPTGRHLLTASSGTGTRSTCGKIGNSYVSITDADVAAGSMNSENRVIMTEWRGAGYCDDDVAPLWTFMDATSTLTESDMYERDVLGAARVAAPAAEARCYRDGGDSIRLTCLPDGVLSVLSFFCADGCGADDAANEVRTGEHLLVNVTSERGEVCDAAAGAAPRIVSSCGGLAVAQSFSGALATAAGPFGSFRGYRAPMESLRETHPLWVGARGPGAKNVTAAKAENEMLASLGYETTPALNHLCLDSTDREAMGWTKHSPSTNDGYISIATDDPKSWCAGHDYVSLECPRNDDTLHVWCANADQLDGAARKPSGECRGEPITTYHCPGLPRPERFVWNGIDLGGAYRASLYKQGYFAELIPTPCDASGPVANGGLGGCADPLPHGESCEPTCNSGSYLSGRRTCHDGRLIDTAKCVKPCDASGSIANGVAGECGGVLAHGASCVPTCDVGYELSGGRSCDDGAVTDTATCAPLDHFCLHSEGYPANDALGWTRHDPSTNDGYLSFELDDPASWCEGHDYVSLECPRVDDTVHVYCANADQLGNGPSLPIGQCRNEDVGVQNCPGFGANQSYVWNGIDLGGAFRASMYKRGAFQSILPPPPPAPAPAPAPAPTPEPTPTSKPAPRTVHMGAQLRGELLHTLNLYAHNVVEPGHRGWYYVDEQGDQQGPFPNKRMRKWFANGHLSLNLPVLYPGRAWRTPLAGRPARASERRQPVLAAPRPIPHDCQPA